MHESIELSIIIVTWNSEQEIEDCLSSIFVYTSDLKIEIIIVDNNSSDNTIRVLEKFENQVETLQVIFNQKNFGFTRACNQGVEIARGNNILLLNPDTKILESSLQKLIKKLNSDELIGAVAPQLLNADYTIQKSCRNFPTYFDMFCELSLLSYIFPQNKLLSRWKMNFFDHNKTIEVEQPMGAALMLKQKVIHEAENFDERYLMFFNDVDLCKKIYDNQYKIVFYPDAKIIHKKGVSVYKDRVRMIKVWNTDCLRYFRKYHYNFFSYSFLVISLHCSGFLRIIFYKAFK